MKTLLDLSFPVPSSHVFDKIVVCSWYDGITSGIAASSQYGIVYRLDIIAWGPRQETRVFAMSPIAIQSFEEVVKLLSAQEKPNWPIWFPASLARPTSPDRIREGVWHLVSKIDLPQCVVASDSMFETLIAVRQLEEQERPVLSTDFSGQPVNEDFHYWKGRLALPD